MTSSSQTPPPRPALRKADDGTVHPAAPHLSSLAVSFDIAAKKSKEDKEDKPVDLVVPVTKATRKRLRKRAEEYGWSAEEAAEHVLRVWSES